MQETDVALKEERRKSGKIDRLAGLARFSALYAVFGYMALTKSADGRLRFRSSTTVAARGVADLTWSVTRIILGSQFGVIPPAALSVLIQESGLLPIRGKQLVPWLGTKLEALTSTFKGAVGYLAALFSAIHPDGWLEDKLFWAAKLTNSAGDALETDGAGWYIVDGDFPSKLSTFAKSRYFTQVRLVAPEVLGLVKGGLYPVRWEHLPVGLRTKYEALRKRKLKGELVELPLAVIDREQFKAGGAMTTTPLAQTKGMKAFYAEFVDFAKDAIDTLENWACGPGEERDYLSFRGNLGVMAVMRPDRMKLGPQITLRVGKGAEDLYVKILRKNWAKWTRSVGHDGNVIDPLTRIYDAAIGQEESGEAARAKSIALALGLDYRQVPALATLAKDRFLKKLYRFGCSMGLMALSAPLVIADNVAIPDGSIVCPIEWFNGKNPKLRHGQKVVFGRYPIVGTGATGASIYVALDPRRLSKETMRLAPWLRYTNCIVGGELAIVIDVTGDDDGDRGFVIPEPLFVEAMEKYPIKLGNDLRRLAIEGYQVDKSKAKMPARNDLVELGLDRTGPVGVYTKCQDALLRLFGGYDPATETWCGEPLRHPNAMKGLFWGMGAMSFMVQCAVDSKKNIIPVYRWWLLAKESFWTTEQKYGVKLTKPSPEFCLGPKAQIVSSDDEEGFGKVPTKHGWRWRWNRSDEDPEEGWQKKGQLLREDGSLSVGAVFSWLFFLVESATGFVFLTEPGGPSRMQQLLPWDRKDRKSPVDHFEDGFAVDEIHPLDTSYNVFLGLVRKENFPSWLVGNDKADTPDAAVAAMAKLDVVPKDFSPDGGKAPISAEGVKLLKQTGWSALVNKLNLQKVALSRQIGGAEGRKAVVDWHADQVSAAKLACKEPVSKLTLEELLGLYQNFLGRGLDAAAWQLLTLGSNALTRALSIPEEQVCTFLSSRKGEFHSRLLGLKESGLWDGADGFTHAAAIMYGVEVVGGVKVAEALTLNALHKQLQGIGLAECPHCQRQFHGILMGAHRDKLVLPDHLVGLTKKVNHRLNAVEDRNGVLLGTAKASRTGYPSVEVNGKIVLIDGSKGIKMPLQAQMRRELLGMGISQDALLSDREVALKELEEAYLPGAVVSQMVKSMQKDFSLRKFRVLLRKASAEALKDLQG